MNKLIALCIVAIALVLAACHGTRPARSPAPLTYINYSAGASSLLLDPALLTACASTSVLVGETR